MLKRLLVSLIIVAALYTRFVGLDWGLPYPMHPDERNMAVSLMNLTCPTITALQECLHPHFFAYGQFPLYLGYAIVLGSKFIRLDSSPISFTEATIALRTISALSSLLLLYSLYRLTQKLLSKSRFAFLAILTVLSLAIYSPFLIQSAHFGTTETFLMLLYCEIVRISIGLKKKGKRLTWGYCGALLGIAIATKVSALQFGLIPFVVWIRLFDRKHYIRWLGNGLALLLMGGVAYVVSSPHNVISYKEFFGSIYYELAVGRGLYKAFYTRTFDDTVPMIFQLHSVLPYALGFGSALLGTVSMIVLTWRNAKLNLLRVALMLPLLSSVFLYAKWTRFSILSLPLIYVFIALMVESYYSSVCKRRSYAFLVPFVLTGFYAMISGIAYLSIYRNSDTRVRASEWIYQHVLPHSVILSETANVVDVPLTLDQGHHLGSYKYISFDFYNLDTKLQLQHDLRTYLAQADYIVVPSRRLFANHTCMRPANSRLGSIRGYLSDVCAKREALYPQLHNYYETLFTSGNYEKVAEFTSYPQIQLFGHMVFSVPDEFAEETWSVFDHPVVRIYKRKTSAGFL
ncbi:MAG: hypothetical protein UZ21_OP11001001162 [Microgenomates bacterium OLB22]|nr:MAG: hypothetical protein UZ21_OP11001001162 [Microgenomates bacterium OLB22]